MKHHPTKQLEKSAVAKSTSEILILANGKILAHNISSGLASVLAELNPADEAMNQRTVRKHILKNELPN
jgi:hypothetical protein